MRYVGLFSCISLVPRSNRPGKGHRAPSAICTVSKTHRHFARIEDRHSAFLDTRGCRAVLHPPTREAISHSATVESGLWLPLARAGPSRASTCPLHSKKLRTSAIGRFPSLGSIFPRPRNRKRLITLVRSNRSIRSVTLIPRRRTKRFRARQPRGNLSRESRSPQRRGRSRRGWCPAPRRWDSSRP